MKIYSAIPRPFRNSVCLHDSISLVIVCRQYAATVKRPYTVRYDPYTQSIQILNNKEVIQDVSRVLKGEINCLHEAMLKIECLSVA